MFVRLTSLLLLAVWGSGCAASGSSPGAEEVPDGLHLTDVTAAAGLAGYRHDNGGFGEKWMPEIVGPGATFLDYDGDGWEDVLLAGGGRWQSRLAPQHTPVRALWLYRNQGGSGSGQAPTFVDVTAEAGLDKPEAYSFGATAADYDNDGDADLFVVTVAENLLFRNDGGRFVEVGHAAGLADISSWSAGALFFDADRDGWLDLFVVNYVDWTPEQDIPCHWKGVKGYCTPQSYQGVPSQFYRNNGDGTFTNRTAEAGFLSALPPEKDKALGVAELDFDADGWPDLFVANDTERDLLFRNNGDGTFTEQGIRSGVAFDQYGKARAGMGTDVGVVDSTGQPSIFVGNFSQEMVGIYAHTGNGLFMDRAAVSKVGFPSLMTLTFGLFLFDADLDTDLDLLLANGHVQEHIAEVVEGVTFAQPAQVFLNRGDGTFEEMPQQGVLAEPLVARGAAYADYDRDGDLDVLLTENNGPAHLWRNDTARGGRHYLRVRVVGRESNRDGLGTRIIAEVDGLRMERRIRTGSSYLSQSERVAAFGLGTAEQVDRLEVLWPSGKVETFEAVAGDREVLLEEGSGVLQPVMPDAAPALARR